MANFCAPTSSISFGKRQHLSWICLLTRRILFLRLCTRTFPLNAARTLLRYLKIFSLWGTRVNEKIPQPAKWTRASKLPQSETKFS
eukprot:26140_6